MVSPVEDTDEVKGHSTSGRWVWGCFSIVVRADGGGDIPVKELSRAFQAKGHARPRPEVGKSLSSSRNRKAARVSSA